MDLIFFQSMDGSFQRLLLLKYIIPLVLFSHIGQGLSLMCLQCNDAVQPRHCHTITYCAEDEVCLEQNETNLINYNGDGNHRPFTCTECCQSDLCNAEGCGQPGYPVERGPICFACYQHDNARECREIAHCRDSELCYIKEDDEFGDQIYSTGCLPFQQCLSIVSNSHAIGDLSNSHHFTRSTARQRTSTVPQQSMSTVSSSKSSSTKSNAHVQTSPQKTTTTVNPLHVSVTSAATGTPSAFFSSFSTTNVIPTRINNQNGNTGGKPSKPVSVSVTSSTAVPTGITESLIHFIDETDAPIILSDGLGPVAPKTRRKRFTSCHQCCTGDLCNDVCKQNNPLTHTPNYYTITPPTTSKYVPPTTSTTLSTTTSTPKPPPTSTSTTSSTTTISTSPSKTETTATATLTTTITTPTTTTTPATTVSTPITTFPAMYSGIETAEFLLAFSKHVNHEAADNISLVVTAPKTGKISIYSAFTRSYVNMTLSKGRNLIPMDPSQAASIPWNEYKGIHILSDVNVSVSVMESTNGSNTEFSVMPVSDLSTRYVASMPKGKQDKPSFVTVIALQNDTKVRFDLHITDKNKYTYITPWKNYRYENGESFEVNLNQYETFRLEVNGTDLSGTTVEGSKSIAAFAGAESNVTAPTACTFNCESQTDTYMLPPTNH